MSKLDLRGNDEIFQAIESLLTLVTNQKPKSFIVLADLGNQQRFGAYKAKNSDALIDLVSHAIRTNKDTSLKELMQRACIDAVKHNFKNDREGK